MASCLCAAGIISIWQQKDFDQERRWVFFYCWEDITQLETLLCEGLTIEKLQRQLQVEAAPQTRQQQQQQEQAMKFTYKRRLFTSNSQELIVPSSTRAVKFNKFVGEAMQVYTADERVGVNNINTTLRLTLLF